MVTVRIARLDHLIFTVRDIGEICTFYERVLGMEIKRFAGERMALHFGDQKINLHKAGAEFEPKAARPTPGSADLCLVLDGSFVQAVATLQSEKIELIEGPVERIGAVGSMQSIYFRHPDGNLIGV
ncbi:MAG: VOC family protein [Alphaproteobacteria bacterium]|nr:VOC family protein [Alphaproteobacteria bacterium]